MAEREKLIELMREGRYKAENICNDNDDCQSCTIADPKGNCKANFVADHLIANGVTVQKWIPVTERLPTREDANETESILAIHKEERRGRWQEGYLIHKYGCSSCGARQDMISPYCPNCGADMRGEESGQIGE